MMPLVRPWTETDIEKLKKMAASGASSIACAAALKRNVQAIRRQASRLGINLPGMRERRRQQRAAEAAAIERVGV